jgi:hypothetical protein
LALFDIFKKQAAEEDERVRAKTAYEKVANLESEGHEARSMRLGMSMLCRAHLDKTFVAGAQQTEAHELAVLVAIQQAKEVPEPPQAPLFQKIKSGLGEALVYLPSEYADEAFAIGMLYQKTELTAQQAIDAAQRLADRICYDTLKLNSAFVALQFLRDELAEAAAQVDAGEGDAADEGSAPAAGAGRPLV